VLPVPTLPVSTAADRLANGKAAFTKICAQCHGPKGEGDGPQAKQMKNEDGTENVPRNLTAGVFKAGGDPADLYTRIRLGIPGTPMPATPPNILSDAEVADLISFVLSLSEPRADGVAIR
jgi:mono/diheme cytochrome c family protein